MPNNASLAAVISIAALVGVLAYLRWQVPARPSYRSFLSSNATADDVWSPGHTITTAPTCLGGSLRLTDILGEGRNSIVFAATTRDEDPKYAVKVRSAVGDSDGQLTREYEVLVALNSTEGFPRIYCHVPEKNFLVMELLVGYKPLTKLAPRSPPPLPINQLVENLINRFESVHEAGYVHVDVHRRNILVNEATGGVALIDFGLAVAHHEQRNPKYVNLYLSGVHEGAQLPMIPIDDIERLVYVLINQFYAPLPWSELFKLREKIEKDLVHTRRTVTSSGSPAGVTDVLNMIDGRVLAKKLELVGDVRFFTTNGIPLQLRALLKYAQSWKRDSSVKINYGFMRSLFMDGVAEQGDVEDDEASIELGTPENSSEEDAGFVFPASSTEK
jgi:predicted Ser/Thr protein kinase